VASALAYRRPVFGELLARLREPRRFIQVLAGPRQTGKTTLARQLMDALAMASHYASADEPALQGRPWLAAQWEVGRVRAREPGTGLLVLDEVHKITDWSATVKRLWDEDTASGLDLRVLLLGSAPLLLQRGLTESLAGRFEVVRAAHWSFGEMRQAFGWDLDRYIFFGGYPGAAPLVPNYRRWRSYVLDSLVETTVSRDVLLLSRVDKPALLRQLFRLGCDYSGQVLPYQKMLGQLQDAGNTTTLAHYLELLSGSGLVTGLQKFSGSGVRQRSSSPKLLVLNTALMSATAGYPFSATRQDGRRWGRLVESAVGAHLVNSAAEGDFEVFYWRERDREVDFVVRSATTLVAIEVKSGAVPRPLPGLAEFLARYPGARPLLVGGDGLDVGEFLSSPPSAWLS
jgi:predicted AAA+ superfamily ATPase